MSAAALIFQPRRRRISLTALIDVVFILLMFFMLTSTFSQWRAIELQAPVASDESPDARPQLVILAADGSLRFQGVDVRVEQVAMLARHHLAPLDPTRALVLLTDGDVSVQEMVAALEQLKAVGAGPVSLGGVLPAPANASQRGRSI